MSYTETLNVKQYVNVVNDEVYKDIRGKVIKDILHGINGRVEWYSRTYRPVEHEDKNSWYVFKTALSNLDETVATCKLSDCSYHNF